MVGGWAVARSHLIWGCGSGLPGPHPFLYRRRRRTVCAGLCQPCPAALPTASSSLLAPPGALH